MSFFGLGAMCYCSHTLLVASFCLSCLVCMVSCKMGFQWETCVSLLMQIRWNSHVNSLLLPYVLVPLQESLSWEGSGVGLKEGYTVSSGSRIHRAIQISKETIICIVSAQHSSMILHLNPQTHVTSYQIFLNTKITILSKLKLKNLLKTKTRDIKYSSCLAGSSP